MKKKLVYASVILFVLTFASKILAFFKESVLAYYYGTGDIADGYLLAQNIISCIFTAVTNSMVIGYITNSPKKEENDNIANTLINFVGILFFFVCIILIIFSKDIVHLFAPGFDNNLVITTSNMLKIISPFAVFFGLNYILTANLHIKNIFWFIGVQGILANLILILSIIFSNKNPVILSIGYGISIFVQAVFVFILAMKKGFRYKIQFNFNKSVIYKIFKISCPIFFIDIFTNLLLIIDKSFASNLGSGIISSFNYANRIIVLITTFFISIITTVILPTLVSKANEKNYESYRKSAETLFIYVLLLILPITIGVLFCNRSLVEVLFMRGAFNIDSLNTTSSVLFIYVMGVPATAYISILKNQLYSLKETKKVLKLTIINFVINIILNLLLVNILGYVGLAVAYVISSYLLFFSLSNSLIKKIGKLNISNLFKNISKICISTGIMALALIIVKCFNINNSLFYLGVSAVIGMLVYFIVLKFLKFEELEYILKLIKFKKK